MFPCDINMFPCDSNMFPCDINSIEDRFDLHRVDRACDIPEVRIRKETEIGLDIITLCKMEMDLTGHSDKQIILCSQNILSFFYYWHMSQFDDKTLFGIIKTNTFRQVDGRIYV